MCVYGYLPQVELQGMRKDPEASESKKELCSMFPHISEAMLQAVLAANENSLEKAIENITAQMQCSLEKHPQTFSSPEALVRRGRYLLDQASQEHCKMGQKNRVRVVCFSLSVSSFTLHSAFRCLELKINACNNTLIANIIKNVIIPCVLHLVFVLCCPSM
jgi:hypothetical protein